MSFGRARAVYVYRPGAITAYDDFTGTSGNLGGDTLPSGGTWTVTGAATDFAAGTNAVTRSTNVVESTPHFAHLAASQSDTEVGITVNTATSAADKYAFAIARYVSTTSYLAARLHLQQTGAPGAQLFQIVTVVGGVETVLAGAYMLVSPGTDHAIRLIVFSSGRVIATVGTTTIEASSSVLATGGALATGKAGFADQSAQVGAAVTRTYDGFYVSAPDQEPIVCYSGQSIEFSSTSTLREDSTGTYAGPPPEYVGGRFTVPPAGGENRQTRIAVMAKRNDVETMPDDNIADATTVEVWVTPRYLVVPR